MFNWLAEVEGEGQSPGASDQLKTLELRLPNWLFKGLMSGKGVLTLDREWFLLKGGLERVIYRIARKHAGDQRQGWTCRVDLLYKKTGSEDQQRNFAAALRKLAARNDLPGYAMSLTKTVDGSDAVHFVARRHLAAAPIGRKAKQLQERDVARAAWIDSGRNPREFDAALAEWTASGASLAQFIDTYQASALTR